MYKACVVWYTQSSSQAPLQLLMRDKETGNKTVWYTMLHRACVSQLLELPQWSHDLASQMKRKLLHLMVVPRPSSFRLLYSIPKQWGIRWYISSCVDVFLGRQREVMTRTTMKPSVLLEAGHMWNSFIPRLSPLQFLIAYSIQKQSIKAINISRQGMPVRLGKSASSYSGWENIFPWLGTCFVYWSGSPPLQRLPRGVL